MPLLLLGAVALIAAMCLNHPEKSPAPTMTITQTVDDAIIKGITKPLGLPDVATIILRIQSKLETGSWNSKVFGITHSLFNRHAGSGRGDWLGAGMPKGSWVLGKQIYYAKPGDEDLRMFADVYQSARDMAQLLQDPLYVQAFGALRRGNPVEYANAVRAAGFAADPQYAASLIRDYKAQGIA